MVVILTPIVLMVVEIPGYIYTPENQDDNGKQAFEDVSPIENGVFPLSC